MLWLLKMIWYRLVRNLRPQLERAANLRLLQELVREPSTNDDKVGVMLAFATAGEQIALLQRECIEARWNDRQSRLQAVAEVVHTLAKVMERVQRSAKHAAPMFLVHFADIKDAIFKTHGTLVTEAAREQVVSGHWGDFVGQSIKALQSGESEMRCLVATLKYVIRPDELLDAKAFQKSIRSEGFAAALDAISAEKGLEIQFADMDAPSVPHGGICGVWLLSGMFAALFFVSVGKHWLSGIGHPPLWLLLLSMPNFAIWGMWCVMWQRRLRLHVMRHIEAYRRVRAAAQA